MVTKSSGSPEHIGKTSIVTTEVARLNCCFSNFMQRLRVKPPTNPYFAWRLLNSNAGRQQFVFYTTTTTGLGNLNGTILGNCCFAFPTPAEQSTIAAFLRRYDAKVRRFIRNRRRLIEVLNEQKQAIINRAVTRGLDPNAPLKPSGIEWLGDIPEHWAKTCLKYVASVQTGITLGKNYFGKQLEDRPTSGLPTSRPAVST